MTMRSSFAAFGMALAFLVGVPNERAINIEGSMTTEEHHLSQAPKEHPVKAQLLADASQIHPGQTFTLGVLFDLQPGWHIYWQNPGDAGLATTVTFALPEGFQLGKLQWPLPKKFIEPGDIVTYGYTNRTLLMTTVRAPDNLRPGSTVELRARAAWLCCRKICIPGQTALRLELPIGQSRPSPHTALFATWRSRLPRPIDEDERLRRLHIEGGFSRGETSTRITLTLEWTSAPADIEWFPAADPALSVTPATIRSRDRRTEITVPVSILPGRTPRESFWGLVVYRTPDGHRRGIIVPIHLRAEAVSGTRSSTKRRMP
ncbi:MAG: hypothetical protein D6723_00345 [Acidobacteria bacterium]|nr:MAG: hypothetical protein D6723_00345 [Acidobacteriota bacterium]